MQSVVCADWSVRWAACGRRKGKLHGMKWREKREENRRKGERRKGRKSRFNRSMMLLHVCKVWSKSIYDEGCCGCDAEAHDATTLVAWLMWLMVVVDGWGWSFCWLWLVVDMVGPVSVSIGIYQYWSVSIKYQLMYQLQIEWNSMISDMIYLINNSISVWLSISISISLSKI